MSAPDIHGEGRRQRGRGVLSSIERLPEVCDDDIAWVNEQLQERRMPQSEILRRFNARLAEKGVKGISKGAFARYTSGPGIDRRKLDAGRQFFDGPDASEHCAGDPIGAPLSGGFCTVSGAQRFVLISLLIAARPDPKLIRSACELFLNLLANEE